MVQIIAYGLDNGNPVAYLLLFMLLYPPIMVILFAVIDWIKSGKLSHKGAFQIVLSKHFP